jgi:hypothetical protein
MEAFSGFFLLLKTFGGLTLAPVTLLNLAESSVSNSPDSPANDRDAAWESDYQDDSADGPRVSLEIEVLRPVFKVLGHCLMAPLSTPNSQIHGSGRCKSFVCEVFSVSASKSNAGFQKSHATERGCFTESVSID